MVIGIYLGLLTYLTIGILVEIAHQLFCKKAFEHNGPLPIVMRFILWPFPAYQTLSYHLRELKRRTKEKKLLPFNESTTCEKIRECIAYNRFYVTCPDDNGRLSSFRRAKTAVRIRDKVFPHDPRISIDVQNGKKAFTLVVKITFNQAPEE